MKLTSASKGANPQNYVRHLHLRNPASSEVYRCILNGFQRLVAEQVEDGAISQDVVRRWLLNRIQVWPLHMVTHRARIVDRFLDWMVNRGALANNPFGDLRTEYGQRTTSPVVRALLSPNFQKALDALRPVPRFGSFLGPKMREHVALMKSMGYRYTTQERRLLLLDRFLQSRPEFVDQPLPALIQGWASTRSTPQQALECHQTGRLLSRALSRIDATVETIPWDKRILQAAQQRHRRPHIYSEQEVHCLMATALRLPSPQSPLRPQTLHMMVILAYCAGLRIGEIVRLNVGDFDVDDRTIEIHGTKFFKSRRLPLSGSVVEVLKAYLAARQQAGAPTNPESAMFWHQQAAGRYSKARAGTLLVDVLRNAGLKPALGRTGPRAHDLRHAFVVNRMLTWYREGINPQSRLPYLATYLGHKDINSTLVYLTITQELLQAASERFRMLGAQVLRASTERGNA
jgi:integrase